MSLKELFKKYSVTIVMVPAIIGIHFGWQQMQNNRKLVSEEEQQKLELPPVTLAKYVLNRFSGNDNDTAKNATEAVK